MSTRAASSRLPLLPVVVSLLLAALLAWAGLAKLLAPRAFADTLHAYDVLPVSTINLVALGLPILEILAAIALLLPSFRQPGALLSGLLALSFVLALASALGRGVVIDCGCFGSASFLNLPPAWSLVRAVVLLLASGWLYLRLMPAVAKAETEDRLARA